MPIQSFLQEVVASVTLRIVHAKLLPGAVSGRDFYQRFKEWFGLEGR